MAPAELHPELWIQIIELLVRPLPRPNGKQDRSAITQHDLLSCARVSKLFHNIASPLLYRRAVCDHFPSLVYGIDRPAAANGIKSKRELLGHLERLHLEYYPKNEATYAQILHAGAHIYDWVGLNQQGLAGLCVMECDWIAFGARKLGEVQTKLLSVSTGVFLGGRTDIWKPFKEAARGREDYQTPLQRAADALTDLLRLKPVWACERALYGPLTFLRAITCKPADTPRPSSGPSTLTLSLHHAMDELGPAPVLLGGKARWYYSPGTTTDVSISDMIDVVGNGIAGHLEQREDVFRWLAYKGRPDALASSDVALNVDIYVPAILMAEQNERMLKDDLARILREVEKSEVPRARYEKDIWRFKSIEDRPDECEACGWRVDDLEYD